MSSSGSIKNTSKDNYGSKIPTNHQLTQQYEELGDEYVLGDSEGVEEIVYHVNEEGFLVDENGNFIVDEQGNFLKLSADQLKEIENNDIIYDEREEYN